MFSTPGAFSFASTPTGEKALESSPTKASAFTFGSSNPFGGANASSPSAGSGSKSESIFGGKSLFAQSSPTPATPPLRAQPYKLPQTPSPASSPLKQPSSLFANANLPKSQHNPNPNPTITEHASKTAELQAQPPSLEAGNICGVAVTGKTLAVLEKVEHHRHGADRQFIYTALRCCRLDGSLIESPAAGAAGSSPVYEEISCWPCLPEFSHAPICVEFNADGTMLLIVSSDRVAVVRFQPLRPLTSLPESNSRRSQAASTLQGVYHSVDGRMDIHGTWKAIGAMGAFQDEVVTLNGRVEAKAGGTLCYSGMLSGTKKGRFQVSSRGSNFGLAEAQWSGFISFEVAGSAPVEMPMQLLMLDRSPGREEGSVMVQCSVGRAQVSLAQSWCIKEVTWGGWYPLSSSNAHFLLLTADGHVRMFDAREDLEDCAHELRVQRDESRPQPDPYNRPARYVACSFGNPSSSVDTTQSEAVVWKRLTLFVLRSDGAVLAHCPYVGPGIHIISSQEIAPLRAKVKDNLHAAQASREDTEASDYDDEYEEDLTEQLQWLQGRRRRANPRTRLLAPLAQTPPPSSSAVATAFAILPIRDSAAFVVLRAWADAIVDVLFAGASIQPMWQRKQASPQPQVVATAPLSTPAGAPLESPASAPSTSASPSRARTPKDVGKRIKEAIQQRNQALEARRDSRLRKASETSIGSASDMFEEDRGNVEDSERDAAGRAPDSDNPATLNVLHGFLCLVHRVRAFELPPQTRAQLCVIPDVVYSDVCLVVDKTSGAMMLLWLPFLDKLKHALSGEPAAQQDALFTKDSQFWICFGRSLSSIKTSPHLSCCLGVGPQVGHYVLAAMDDGVETLELSSHCLSLRAMRVPAMTDLEAGDGDEKTADAGEKLARARKETARVDAVFQRLLEEGTRVPKQLMGLRFDDDSVAPALQIAGMKWLQDTFNVLTIGRGKRIGLLAAIQARLEELDATRLGQDAAFAAVQGELKSQQEEVEALHKENTELSSRCAQLLQLQKATEEALEDSMAQARAINPRLTPAERRFHARVVRAEERVRALMERAATNSGLERRVESVVQTEVAQMKQMSAARQPVEFADAEVEAQVKDLQTRTSERIGEMMQAGASLMTLRERVEKLRETIQPVMTLGTRDAMLVLLVSLKSPKAEEIAAAIGQRRSHTKMLIEKDIVGRGYQSMVRRQLGLNADSFPYHLRVGRLQEQQAGEESPVELIHIILLDQAVKLLPSDDEREDDVKVGLSDGGKEFERDWVKVKVLRRASTDAGIELIGEVEQLRDLFQNLLRLEQDLQHADAFSDVHMHFKQVL